MLKLKKFDATDLEQVYMYPNGEIATAERILQDFPAAARFTHVLELNGEVCQAVINLSALRGIHNIDPELSDDEAIEVIEGILNAPPMEVDMMPTPEERIAAALEFQNLMMM